MGFQKKYLEIIVLSLTIVVGFIFAQSAKAETYTYTATNFQPISCPYGSLSQVTPMNLTSPGDNVTIVGTGFGNRNITDSVNESVYIPNPTTGGVYNVYRGQRSESSQVVYFGLMSWNDSEIGLEVRQGLADSLGSYIILRTHSSPSDNQGSCVRGTLTAGLICTSFTYSDWAICQSGGTQTRIILNSYPTGCSGGNPTVLTQSCVYTPPTCTSWVYSDWGVCSVDAKQTRTVLSSSPESCTGGTPVISQSCKRPPPKITSISPSAINYTELVEIVGENFGTRDSNSKIFGPNNREQKSVHSWSDTKIKVVVGNFEDPRNFYLIVQRERSELETFPVMSNAFPLKVFPWGTPKITQVLRSHRYGSINPPDVEVSILGENFGMPGNRNVSVSNARVYDTEGLSYRVVTRGHDVIVIAIDSINWNKTNDTTTLYVKVKCLDEDCSSGVDGPDGKDYVSNSFPISLDIPRPCTTDTWSCGNWNTCSISGSQTRTCNKTFDCSTVSTPSPATSQSCTPPPSCTADAWDCNDWSVCSANGNQNRSCTKTFDCPTVTTQSPLTSQSCTPPPKPITPTQPACDADTWTCGNWNSCSLSGIQNRSCRKTFDCSSVETAPPVIDQYCEPPNRPTPQTPPSGTEEILNQDSIIKSTVKLLCPVDAQRASQGSGTIIDSNGTILTNKHVIAGTLGCLVGFINDFNDEPYFGERHIADIAKVSPNQDIAILKIRNPQSKNLVSVDITRGSSNLRLGTKVTTYGFPAKFGTKITYTSGDFSGTDGSYIKTTAILEYGNSGGGSYLKDGTFIGIPSAVVKGELNALGYILSINTINSWLGNSGITYGGTSNNNYSRVSVLEDIDLKKLGSLKLFIPDTDAKGNLATPPTNQNTQKITEQPKINQTQKESIIEPTDTNQKVNPEQNNPAPSEKEQKPKAPWFKRFFNWLVNLF